MDAPEVPPLASVTMRPIGVVRSAFADKVSAPRQPFVAPEATGHIELLPGHHYEDALADLTLWTHIWVLFVFDRNATWHPKVMPPHGSDQRRGVFATRSPHRPNPIGMSVVRLLGVDGLILRVAGLDILDGTPVLDVKPYVPDADIVGDASRGWLEPTTATSVFTLTWTAQIEQQLAWWQRVTGEDLRPAIKRVLEVTPHPHAFRRIRKGPHGMVLGLPGWRIDFRVEGATVGVIAMRSGHHPADVFRDKALHAHRAFIAEFGE